MAIITKALICVALVCMISALPFDGGQDEAQVDLLSIDEVPLQDDGITADGGQVREKRHGYYGGGYGYPVYGYGGGFGIGGFGGGIGFGYPVYGGYGYGHRHHHHHGGYYGGFYG